MAPVVCWSYVSSGVWLPSYHSRNDTFPLSPMSVHPFSSVTLKRKKYSTSTSSCSPTLETAVTFSNRKLEMAGPALTEGPANVAVLFDSSLVSFAQKKWLYHPAERVVL